MKEIELIETEKQEKVSQVKIEPKQEFIGSTRKIPGLTLFEYNPVTKNITKAKIEIVTTLTAKGPEYKHKVILNDKCFYEQALNLKNAQKKFNRFFMAKIAKAMEEQVKYKTDLDGDR